MVTVKAPFLGLKASSLAGLILAFTTAMCANSAAAGNVYQVEMIVFERNARTLDSDVETWERKVAPEYPAHWQHLIDPTEQAAETARLEKEGSMKLSDDFLQTLAEERAAHDDASPTIVMETSPPVNDQPAYFQYLPEAARNLQKTRDALVRRNQYRILFHETWLQPMEAPEKAPALILHGGKKYGDLYELQGYITLGVSRFLHVQTDLWLSEFSINQGQDSAHGLRLPPEPQNSSPEGSNTNAAAQYEAANSETVNLTNRLDNTSWSHSDLDLPESVDRPPYLVNEIVSLKQKRRMRSGELHYLDNPRMGLLIKFTPQ